MNHGPAFLVATALAASAIAVAGCSPRPARDDAASGDSAQAPPSEEPPAEQPASNSAAPEAVPSPLSGRTSRYTSLEGCKVLREERDEMPMTEVACPGAGRYSLQVLDSDARQILTLISPSTEPYRLPTARIGGGGFSSFGKTAEWRGPAAGSFDPDSLIVRYQVAEQPYPAPETSYLLVVRLGPDPCLVARVPPGTGQNDSARAAADDPGACVPG